MTKTNLYYLFKLLLFSWLIIYSSQVSGQNTKLNIGDKIPQFELLNQSGRMFNSTQYIGEKSIVFFFFPSDEEKLNYKQFNLAKDSISSFNKYNAILIGINQESLIKHKEFITKNRLPISILFDRNNEVQNMFGVPFKKRKETPQRYTFIINKHAIIVNIISNNSDPIQLINQSIMTLRNLN